MEKSGSTQLHQLGQLMSLANSAGGTLLTRVRLGTLALNSLKHHIFLIEI